jgi:hypothetical protein
MMFRVGRRRVSSVYYWDVVAIILAVLLLAGILIVNIAGQGYEQQQFKSSSYNQSAPSFPTRFLLGSLKDSPGCDPQSIREGDGMSPDNSQEY